LPALFGPAITLMPGVNETERLRCVLKLVRSNLSSIAGPQFDNVVGVCECLFVQ